VDGDLGHVLDEHGGSSDLAGLVDDLVEGQAVPAKMAQFAGAPPDLGLELHDRPDIGPMTPLQQPEGLGARSWSTTVWDSARPCSSKETALTRSRGWRTTSSGRPASGPLGRPSRGVTSRHVGDGTRSCCYPRALHNALGERMVTATRLLNTRVSQITVSVRSARPSSRYCLRREDL